MESIQSDDQADISLTSTFNTAQSSILDSESPSASNIYNHCRPREPHEPERKGKYYTIIVNIVQRVIQHQLQGHEAIFVRNTKIFSLKMLVQHSQLPLLHK
jgi:hypothetical protein